MKAADLYDHLERDFVRPGITDVWYKYMPELSEYICPSFKERSIGLVCDFAKEISKVYCAVFPPAKVLEKIIDDGTTDAMLFVHHAAIWELGVSPSGFYNMDPALLDKLRERHISIFNFHHPLDNYGEYSTGKTLADVLGIAIERRFAEFGGAMAGIIGTSECKSVAELNEKYSLAVGHETKLYKYGEDAIKDGKVAIVAGGGNQMSVAAELVDLKINVFITGLTVKNERSKETHEFEEKNKINVLGGTHYSTEKFACMAMCGYFEKLGLPSEFIEEIPCFDDM